ncbi:MAG: peptidase M75 [Bacteroidales bacterium]|jgi:predicted lipoprotein|nr:peptidase M75 [Bacteroidales bacterium]
MKSKFIKVAVVLWACILVAGLHSCKKDTNPETTSKNAELLEIIKNYTDNTVIKTYGLLADKSIELLEACKELQASPSAANVAAATQKWIEARKYWEMTEAFLYGPAEYYNLDPRIDSWPLDKNSLDQYLALDMSDVDATYVRENYGVSLIGFHAIEYVIFDDGQPKDVSKITTNELIYLVSVAEVLQEDCIRLEAAWNENISSEKQEILEAAELEITFNFGQEMINAGSAGSRFVSPVQAIHEIVSGCETIADEVGNEKIADPYTSKNVLDVESWYSWNSLTDFTDNIYSIENSYLGGMEGSRTGRSLSDYVKSRHAQLDTDIRAAIKNAIDKIQAIPAPFRNQLNNAGSAPAIEEAMEACNHLMELLSLINEVVDAE